MYEVYTPLPKGLPPGADDNYILRRIYAYLMNGYSSIGPVEENNTLLRKIYAVYESGTGTGGGSGGGSTVTKIQARLSGGQVVITSPAITTSSSVVPSHLATSTANSGALFVQTLSNGSATIASTNSADNDTIEVVIQ